MRITKKHNFDNMIKLGLILIIIIKLNYCNCRTFGTVHVNKSRLSIESNSIQRDLNELQSNQVNSDNINNIGTKRQIALPLKRVFISNRTITCNDGSQAGFYLRKSPGSKRWVVFLEGGWHCYDVKSCRARWLKLRHLMTSAQWPDTRDVGGILSSVPEENPYWYNANHVLVPYCSSDSWSGTKMLADTRDGWRFMGSLIIRQVIADLIPLGLGRPSGAELLLAGSSAGGLGVMLNLDRISNFLQNEKDLKVLVRGVSDSGWFLDREPYTPSAVAASEAVRQGWKMWGGSLPEQCIKLHSVEPWRCYFGYRLYPTLKSPLFVFQWLFDEAQMRADNVGAPVTPQQWNYIHDMGGALRQSLDNVTAVFAPSCIGHAVLSKRDWLNIKIDDISLPEALRCWEQSTRRKHNKLRRASETKRNDKKRRHNQKHRNQQQDQLGGDSNINGGGNKRNGRKLTKEEREQKRRHNNERKRKQQERRLLRAQQQQQTQQQQPQEQNKKNDQSETPENRTPMIKNANRKKRKNNNGLNSDNYNKGTENNNKKRRKNKEQRLKHPDYQREQEQPSFDRSLGRGKYRSHHQQHHQLTSELSSVMISEPKKCSLRLLERCSWPQCNHSCPSLTNPLTGEEMRFLELLTSFGLDIEAVAAALGVDMQTLNNMDQTELVNLLTQQVS